MLKRSLPILATLAAFCATPANAAVIIDENFETDFGVFNASGNVHLATGATYQACCGTDPSYTNQFVAFGGGNQESGTILSTAFNTVAGLLYTVTFNYGALGIGTEPLIFSVGATTYTVNPVALDGPDNLNTTFQQGTFTFFGTGALMSLQVVSGGVNNVDAVLDDVLVTSVPEPEIWAMLLLGFLGIGWQLRRRQQLRAVTA